MGPRPPDREPGARLLVLGAALLPLLVSQLLMSPARRFLWPDPPAVLPVLVFFASLGPLVAVIGALLRERGLLWVGAGGFAFFALLFGYEAWLFSPMAILLLLAAAAWHAAVPPA